MTASTKLNVPFNQASILTKQQFDLLKIGSDGTSSLSTLHDSIFSVTTLGSLYSGRKYVVIRYKKDDMLPFNTPCEVTSKLISSLAIQPDGLSQKPEFQDSFFTGQYSRTYEGQDIYQLVRYKKGPVPPCDQVLFVTEKVVQELGIQQSGISKRPDFHDSFFTGEYVGNNGENIYRMIRHHKSSTPQFLTPVEIPQSHLVQLFLDQNGLSKRLDLADSLFSCEALGFRNGVMFYRVTRYSKEHIPPFDAPTVMNAATVANLCLDERGYSKRPDLQDSFFNCEQCKATTGDVQYKITRYSKAVIPPLNTVVEMNQKTVCQLYLQQNGLSTRPDLQNYCFNLKYVGVRNNEHFYQVQRNQKDITMG